MQGIVRSRLFKQSCSKWIRCLGTCQYHLELILRISLVEGGVEAILALLLKVASQLGVLDVILHLGVAEFVFVPIEFLRTAGCARYGLEAGLGRQSLEPIVGARSHLAFKSSLRG